jgi:hypothetical protein
MRLTVLSVFIIPQAARFFKGGGRAGQRICKKFPRFSLRSSVHTNSEDRDRLARAVLKVR